jgi:hypothetical protein
MEHVPFGAFNPRFYGVSLFLGSKDRLDFLNRYFGESDLAEGARDTETSALSEVSTVSAVDHEARHFHDFLLSPMGTAVMGLRMQASINGFQTMQALKRCRGKFVPVPLIRWIQWDDAARKRWIDSTGSYFRIAPSDIVALPHSPDVTRLKFQASRSVPDALTPEEELGTYALPAAAAYASMSMWRQRKVSHQWIDINVSADDVFEAVAHVVQMQAVWTGQGQSAAEHFLASVRTSPAKHLYPLQVFWTALERSSQKIDLRRLTELLTWMLLGPWEQLASNGHPATRFFQVLEMCVQAPDNDAFVGQRSSAQLFNLLDELTESRAWMNNLTSATALADRNINSYAEISKTLKGGYFDALFAVATAWHHDQSSVRKTFLETPESLVDPLQYVSETRLPLPFVEIRFGSMIRERDDRLDSPNVRAIAVDAEGKKVLSYIGKPPSQSSEALDNARWARMFTHMVDFLFADEPVLGDLYEGWCRSQIQALVGKELRSVY